MFASRLKASTKLTVASTYIAMIIINALANILPINGQSTGQVSDSYPNLFAPAGMTFAIWGVIYFLLAAFTLYLLGFFQDDYGRAKTELLSRVGNVFAISSIANALWIFAWHYHWIPLSMALMLVILVCLILINGITRDEPLTVREKLFIRLPFSVYFGWITVATIANATTLLVALGWDGFGIAEPIWAIAIIIVGMLIGSVTMIRNRDMAYGLVLIWAYAGIWLKHTSEDGFSGQFPSIITTVLACIFLFIIAEAYILRSKQLRKLL